MFADDVDILPRLKFIFSYDVFFFVFFGTNAFLKTQLAMQSDPVTLT